MNLNEMFNEAPDPTSGGKIAVGQTPAQDGPFAQNRKAGTNAGVVSGDYTWMGAQWVNNKTMKVATKDVAAQLGNPMVDELLASIVDQNVVHLVADYIVGRERELDTSDQRSSAKGTRYDNQSSKATTKPNAALNPDQNAQSNQAADQAVAQQAQQKVQ